jgi:hypothetical protein
MNFRNEKFLSKYSWLQNGLGLPSVPKSHSLTPSCGFSIRIFPGNDRVIIKSIPTVTDIRKFVSSFCAESTLKMVDSCFSTVSLDSKLQDLRTTQFPIAILTSDHVYVCLLEEICLNTTTQTVVNEICDPNLCDICHICNCCVATQSVLDDITSAYNPLRLCDRCEKLLFPGGRKIHGRT